MTGRSQAARRGIKNGDEIVFDACQTAIGVSNPYGTVCIVSNACCVSVGNIGENARFIWSYAHDGTAVIPSHNQPRRSHAIARTTRLGTPSMFESGNS